MAEQKKTKANQGQEGDPNKDFSGPGKTNQYGQTEEEFKEAHGGREPEEVYPETGEVDEKFQQEKKEARWG